MKYIFNYLCVGLICFTVGAAFVFNMEARRIQREVEKNTAVEPIRFAYNGTIYGQRGFEFPNAPIEQNENALLWAIAERESGNKLDAVNEAGTRFGKWQVSADIIAAYANQAHPSDEQVIFLLGLDGKIKQFSEDAQLHVALFHLHRLMSAGATTAQEVAHRWNPNAPESYAQEVENLYLLRLRQGGGV